VEKRELNRRKERKGETKAREARDETKKVNFLEY